MKFYEFNEFAYYALVGAKNKEDAVKYFYENVCEYEEDDGEPKELTESEAREKFIGCYDEEIERYTNNEDFNNLIESWNPCLILIDGSLL